MSGGKSKNRRNNNNSKSNRNANDSELHNSVESDDNQFSGAMNDVSDNENENEQINIKLSDLQKLIRSEVTSAVKSAMNHLQSDLTTRFDALENLLDQSVTKSPNLSNELRNVWEGIKTDVSKLTRETKAVSTTSASSSLAAEIPTKVQEAVGNALRENQEKTNKKHNLIFSGVPESSDEDDEAKHDIAAINKIHHELGITLKHTFRLHRLGKNGPKSRIILAQYHEADSVARALLLKNAKKLRLSKEKPMHQVFINPDLTKLEREESWKLRQELKRRRDNGEKVTIRRGAIIDVSETDN